MSHWEQWLAVFAIVAAIISVGGAIEKKLVSIRMALGHIMDKLDRR